MGKFYNVTFSGDYFTTITTVSFDDSVDDYVAIEAANDILNDKYEWFMWDYSNQVTVEEVDN